MSAASCRSRRLERHHTPNAGRAPRRLPSGCHNLAQLLSLSPTGMLSQVRQKLRHRIKIFNPSSGIWVSDSERQPVVRPWETTRRAHGGAHVYFGEKARGGYGEGVQEDHRLFRAKKSALQRSVREESEVRFNCVAAIRPPLERRRRSTTGSSRAPRSAPTTRRPRGSRLAGLKKRARDAARA